LRALIRLAMKAVGRPTATLTSVVVRVSAGTVIRLAMYGRATAKKTARGAAGRPRR